MARQIEFKIYGTRGSCATGTKDYMEFGGDTSSYSLRIDDNLHFLDAGSGIRRAMAEDLTEGISKAYINISHGHEDHMSMGCAGGIYGNKLKEGIQVVGFKAIEQAMPNYFDGNTIWPVPLSAMKGLAPKFQAINGGEVLKYDGYQIQTIPNYHPLTQNPMQGYGGSIGFRFDILKPDTEIVSIAYVSDFELDYMPNGRGGSMPQPEKAELEEKLVSFLSGADLAIMDTHFTQEEYDKTMPWVKGWGHTPLERVIEVATKAKVGMLLGSHHAPQHNDDFLRKQEVKAKEYAASIGFGGNFAYAKDGDVFRF